MNTQRRNLHLDRYVQSCGSEVPQDLEYYKVGGKLEDRCVFCEDSHNYNPLYIYDPINGYNNRKFTEAHTCSECHLHVASMEKREWNIEVPESSDEISRYPQSEHRKNQLLLDLFFDEEVYKYYLHLRPNRDKYVDDRQCRRCYICNKLNNQYPIKSTSEPWLSRSESWLEIEVPVFPHEETTGGKILICEDCEYHISDVHVLYQEKINKRDLIRYKCSNCFKYYLITKEEEEYRKLGYLKNNLLEPEFLCPICTYDSIDSSETLLRSIGNVVKNEAPRYSPMSRFAPLLCDMHLNTVEIDLSLNPNHIQIRYKVGSKNICEACIQAGVKSLVAQRNVSFYDKKHFIVVDSETLGYEIYKLHDYPEMPALIYTAKSEGKDVGDVILTAFEEFGKLNGNS